MKERYISAAFGEKLLKQGKITARVKSENTEMVAVTWTNGVNFIVFLVNGIIVKVG